MPLLLLLLGDNYACLMLVWADAKRTWVSVWAVGSFFQAHSVQQCHVVVCRLCGTLFGCEMKCGEMLLDPQKFDV